MRRLLDILLYCSTAQLLSCPVVLLSYCPVIQWLGLCHTSKRCQNVLLPLDKSTGHSISDFMRIDLSCQDICRIFFIRNASIATYGMLGMLHSLLN